jgi:hypothetical protein
MIQEGLTVNEKQIIKELGEYASCPPIVEYSNKPLLLFLGLLIIVVMTIGCNVGSIQVINGQVIPTDIVSRVSLNIPGPMTELDMIKVDDFLCNQALIDNLMISPIGEL